MRLVGRAAFASMPIPNEQVSYDDELVGASLGDLPAGWDHLVRSWELPAGSFQRAAACVLSWGMNRGSGALVRSPTPRAVANVPVLQGLPFGPVVLLAPCRVVRVVDGPDAQGFAYGTMPGHPEIGEESFVVRRDGDRTWFELRTFSRPATVLFRVGGPVVRRFQRVTAARYAAAIRRACA